MDTFTRDEIRKAMEDKRVAVPLAEWRRAKQGEAQEPAEAFMRALVVELTEWLDYNTARLRAYQNDLTDELTKDLPADDLLTDAVFDAAAGVGIEAAFNRAVVDYVIDCKLPTLEEAEADAYQAHLDEEADRAYDRRRMGE